MSNLRGIMAIAKKDLKTYYFKPPSITWGIVFPFVWILGFYLRNPGNFSLLIPGLVAMTIIFSTTAAESVVITFELKIKSFERLLLSPLSINSILLGKIFGGVIFGFIMTIIVTLVSLLISPSQQINWFAYFLILAPSLFAFSSLGALISVSAKEMMDAQALLNFPRFLMIFISGTFFPIESMPFLLRVISKFMPLTYTVFGIRSSLENKLISHQFLYAGILIIFGTLFFLISKKLLIKRFS